MVNLSGVYRRIGKLDQALQLGEDAFRLTKARLGREHPFVLRCMGLLAETYPLTGKCSEAQELALQMISLSRIIHPAESPELANSLAEASMLLLHCKEFAAAEPLLREVLAIRERSIPDDWRTFNTRSQLGGALMGQGEFSDAEPLLVTGYEGMKVREQYISRGSVHRISEALDRLIDFYTATNQTDLARKYQELRTNRMENDRGP